MPQLARNRLIVKLKEIQAKANDVLSQPTSFRFRYLSEVFKQLALIAEALNEEQPEGVDLSALTTAAYAGRVDRFTQILDDYLNLLHDDMFSSSSSSSEQEAGESASSVSSAQSEVSESYSSATYSSDSGDMSTMSSVSSNSESSASSG